jgi:quinoprotein glucose dehydrogenase
MRMVPVLVAALFVVTVAAGADKTVWDGVYTDAQAARGLAAFDSRCRECHRGGFFQGFIERWREDKLSGIFNFISTRMPRDNPGSARPDQYLDIVTYILSLNNLPAGTEELTPAALGGIQVQRKDGPAPLPDDVTVRVVGCLTQGPDNAWTLTKASEPGRTREPTASTPAELKSSGAQPLGTRTFALPDVDSRSPDTHKGHKVEAKGFVDKKPAGDRILLTALQTVAPTCPE